MPNIRGLSGFPNAGLRRFEIPTEAGQPARLRTWGIPTGAGWWIGPWKWNLIGEPLSIKRFGWLLVLVMAALWHG